MKDKLYIENVGFNFYLILVITFPKLGILLIVFSECQNG